MNSTAATATLLALLLCWTATIDAFSIVGRTTWTAIRPSSPLKASQNDLDRPFFPSVSQQVSHFAATAALCVTLSCTTSAAPAQAMTDYTSDTVQKTLTLIQQSQGQPEETLKAFEVLADIIAEGTGIGGSINYKGVQLDRGYVADEDTSIYNPGLTLLTESEKDRLVQAVIDSRKAGMQSNTWTLDLEGGYDFLKLRLDPLHMNELRGYLGIFPFYAAAVYVVVLGVQQLLRDLFPVAYLVGVGALVVPALALVAAGPQ
eukprot:CAMPEP_0172446966 /NCGR_PEP_ID=MMETSP1065-20121228/6386_1 /TAXON_ID=265537 /ORGANISM="Amphiprora paludosa, Strain CCMP125" /LENGTH=259 /DNA_ID=CAMNT_0013198155 /DNA_START=1 /DNA_END=780 /DNA_ORIENTATION=-